MVTEPDERSITERHPLRKQRRDVTHRDTRNNTQAGRDQNPSPRSRDVMSARRRRVRRNGKRDIAIAASAALITSDMRA